MLTVTPDIIIDDRELEETFVHASGPGGQNVNKVATAVQLRFNLQNSHSLSDSVRDRLRHLAGKRLTVDGILIIDAHRFRTRERNRQDARERLIALIQRAIKPPKVRKPTYPSKAVKQRRLDNKRHRSMQKLSRSVKPQVDE
ncbi:MAG: aminoacyl-tRNA hydrolase [Candidatus Marinimicrobia bacterium]|nr:aminoacyl-tRNA hydrolase [Candidatus Neomarinimicrobiota bacterium]